MRGFTLIEMLVALVLTTLITTLIMQGMSYLWRMQSHYDQVMINASQRDMHAAWWRQSVHDIIATRSDNPHRFTGNAHQFSGLSLDVPGQIPGMPGAVHWKIAPQHGHDELLGNGLHILQLPSGSRFVYLDSARKAHAQWSPQASAPPLPHVIVIKKDDAVVWAASVQQPQRRPLPISAGPNGNNNGGGFVP
ncbi:prepilin-type N-terminal cleavage/methylation domain-containing protein [Salinisphaera sp. RV14]|uniref:prepilin-type N-terminal cleavage/methylation domain-containing protein n=1 Tax=unclassified Salinisphaera TaxID=2649847 RepID=UPI003F87DB6F